MLTSKRKRWFCEVCKIYNPLNPKWMTCDSCMNKLTQDLLELCEIEKAKYKRIKEDATDLTEYYTAKEIELMEASI